MELALSQPQTEDVSRLFVWQKRSRRHASTLAGMAGTCAYSTAVTVDRDRFSMMCAGRMRIAPSGFGAAETQTKNYLAPFHYERPGTVLSAACVSTDQVLLPEKVRQFAATQRITGSVAVALQAIKRLFPALRVEISLESDAETGETVISFTVIPPTSQDLNDLSEMNSRLHDEVFNNLPTKALQFLSFGFGFD